MDGILKLPMARLFKNLYYKVNVNLRENKWGGQRVPSDGCYLGNRPPIKKHVRNSAVSGPDVKGENKPLSGGSRVRGTCDGHGCGVVKLEERACGGKLAFYRMEDGPPHF